LKDKKDKLLIVLPNVIKHNSEGFGDVFIGFILDKKSPDVGGIFCFLSRENAKNTISPRL